MIASSFLLTQSPLIHALTNGISSEFVANSLLAVGAKPIMAEDLLELSTVIQASDAVLVNLGQLSSQREVSIREAVRLASQLKKPVVVDAVGITQLVNRRQLVMDLLAMMPSVVKGNSSELRSLVGLPSQARGVDGLAADQDETALQELIAALKTFSVQHNQTCFLATGERDLVAYDGRVWLLSNGVSDLDRITGTGDVVGALVAALLSTGQTPDQACLWAVTYFNRCGEEAYARFPKAIGSFREELVNQLGYLAQEKNWTQGVQIREV